MANVWPSMNGNGYIRDVPTMADEAFAASLLARTRFSGIYRGSIASFDSAMRRYKSEPENLAAHLEEMYNALYNRLFDDAQVEVKVLDPEPGTINYPITIGIIVTHKGTSYDIGYQLQTRQGAAYAVAGVINGEERTIKL
jgi:hypothetical protein